MLPKPEPNPRPPCLAAYVFQANHRPDSTAPNSRNFTMEESHDVPISVGLLFLNWSRGASGFERMAEDVVIVITLAVLISSWTSDRNGRITYSWLSETSPVMAEMPMNGAVGRLIPFTVKQSVQSSPKGYWVNGLKCYKGCPLTSPVLDLDLSGKVSSSMERAWSPGYLR